jgi:hypothetical protein
MVFALAGLACSLQGVSGFPEHLAHGLGANFEALLSKCGGKMASALGAPAQRAHRVAARIRIHQLVESSE